MFSNISLFQITEKITENLRNIIENYRQLKQTDRLLVPESSEIC